MKNFFIFILALILFSVNGFSQKKFALSRDLFGKRVFIKNNGQFDRAISDNSKKILFAYVNGDEQVYFANDGVTYVLQERRKLSEHEKEAIEHGKKLKHDLIKKCEVNVNWENSNPNIEIIENDLQPYYYSFGEAKYKSNCYKKITYKNVYSHIDIEYVFTNEKSNGLKYNVIVHPGGNVNDVKIKYSGQIEGVNIKKGNVVIKTQLQDIKELAPQSYQDEKKIESNFIVKNKTLSFNFPNGYDNTKELLIDPWVVNLVLPTSNYGYDVDFDNAGNYYVYGGDGPYLVSKYSPAGALMWTFAGTVTTPSWPDPSSLSYPGNFLVDKVSGKTYIGEGFNPVGTNIIRIDQNGLYDNFISITSPGWNELWDMGFDCANNAVFGIGGSITNNSSAGILNTVSGAITPQNFTGLTSVAQDIVSHAIDPSGNIFFVFASFSTPSLDNSLMRVNGTFNGNTWIAPTTYFSFTEANNKLYPPQLVSSNGYNALAANANYLYYYDGFNLAAYNKATGAIIAFTTLAGQTALEQGGIAVDDCDNVYVGGNGSIRCYNFNGTSFVPNGIIPLGVTGPNQYVTDIKYRLSTNELYICGTGFGGTYSAINSITCTVIQSSVTTVCAGNNIGSAVATVSTNIPSPVISYSWANSTNSIVSQTNNSALLTNSATALPNGNYTVYIQINAPCGPINTQTLNINCVCSLTAQATSSCTPSGITTSLSLSATSGLTTTPITYAWTGPGAFSSTNTSTTIANAAPGIYTLNLTAPGCSTSNTVLVTSPSSFTPVLSSSGVSCNGGSNGTSTVNAITGISTAPYTYSWSTISAQTNSFATNLSAGIYTCFVTDSQGCSYAGTTTITQPPQAFLTLASTSVSCFNGSNGTASVAAVPIANTGPYTYTWSTQPIQNSAQAIGLSGGTASCALTDNIGCVFTGTVTVIQPLTQVSVAITSSTNQACAGNSITLSANGAGGMGSGYTYLWFNATALANTTVSELVGGNYNYSVTAFDSNLCPAIAVQTVSFINNPILITSNASLCSGLSTNLTVNGASTYSWSPATGLSSTTGNLVVASPNVNTIYAVTGNNLFCSATANVTVSVVQYPNLSISSPNQYVCEGGSTDIFASGAQIYNWSPSNVLVQNGGTQVTVSPNATMDYTVVGSNSLGTTTCAVQQMITIVMVPKVIPIVSPSQTISICIGEKANFSASGGDTYSWTPSFGLNTTNKPQVVSSATQSTVYKVSVSNNGACAETATVALTVNPLPKVFAGKDSSYNIDDLVFINATGSGTITWVKGENILCKECPNTQVTPKFSDCYIAESVNEFGCKTTDEVCIDITLNDGIYIPNAFTPNGDGLNDVFLVYGYSISEVKIDIFDRWGENLFNSTDITKGWNGFFKSTPCEIGVYVYKVSYKGIDGKKYTKTGHVTINR